MPGNSFKDKELARRAGQKSGKAKKTKQWEELAESIITTHAATFNSIMTEMGDTDKEMFVKIYKDILNYFKPKISYNINQEEKPAIESIKFVVKK